MLLIIQVRAYLSLVAQHIMQDRMSVSKFQTQLANESGVKKLAQQAKVCLKFENESTNNHLCNIYIIYIYIIYIILLLLYIIIIMYIYNIYYIIYISANIFNYTLYSVHKQWKNKTRRQFNTSYLQ